MGYGDSVGSVGLEDVELGLVDAEEARARAPAAGSARQPLSDLAWRSQVQRPALDRG